MSQDASESTGLVQDLDDDDKPRDPDDEEDDIVPPSKPKAKARRGGSSSVDINGLAGELTMLQPRIKKTRDQFNANKKQLMEQMKKRKVKTLMDASGTTEYFLKKSLPKKAALKPKHVEDALKNCEWDIKRPARKAIMELIDKMRTADGGEVKVSLGIRKNKRKAKPQRKGDDDDSNSDADSDAEGPKSSRQENADNEPMNDETEEGPSKKRQRS